MDYLSVKKNRAAALITALLVVAIVATIATILAVVEKQTIDDTFLLQENMQAQWNANGLVLWAATTLENAQKANQFVVLPLKNELSKNFYGANINGEINDAYGKFNINALANPQNQPTFIRLLRLTNPKINAQQATLLTNNITNWLRPSAADEEYLKFNPPYRAPHFLMADISELNLISGITPEIYTQLQPYLVALPIIDNKFNMLTISKPLILSLGDAVNDGQAQALIECQQKSKQTSDAEANMTTCFAGLQIPVDPNISLVTSSDFFLLSGEIEFSQRNFIYQSLLRRDVENGKPVVRQLWQTLRVE